MHLARNILTLIAFTSIAACGVQRVGDEGDTTTPTDNTTGTTGVTTGGTTPTFGGGTGTTGVTTGGTTDVLTTWYQDIDRDGWGGNDVVIDIVGSPGAGWSTVDGDCDDTNPAVNPGMTEIPGNGIDDDCDATTLDGTGPTDADGDGYLPPLDCNDGNSAIHPGAIEVTNGLDDDCDGLIDENNGGCVPTGVIVFYDSVDDDCDGHLECDADADGYDAMLGSCIAIGGDDCNDANAYVNPGENEILSNGVDDDCDASTSDSPAALTWCYDDVDGDGFGAVLGGVQRATCLADEVLNDDDCNDANALVHPGAVEIPANGLDDDCVGGDAPSNPVYVPGTMTMVIVNDGSYLTGATPSWETWAWNMDAWVGNWPGLSVQAYCGTGTTSTIECTFPGVAGDLIQVNGAWNLGTRWLIENVNGVTTSHISQITFNGVIYPVSLVNNANPPVGTCTCDPTSYDLYCQL